MRGNRGTKRARNHTARRQQSPKLVPDPLLLGPHRPLQAARGKRHVACTRQPSHCTAASIKQGMYTDLLAPSYKAGPVCLPQRPQQQVHGPGSGSHLAPPRKRSKTQRPASRKRGAAGCAEQARRSTPGSSRVAPGPRLRRTLAVSDNKLIFHFSFQLSSPASKLQRKILKNVIQEHSKGSNVKDEQYPELLLF